MTTIANKLREITKRLQHLTVWRPNERDPFFELDRWRIDAHTTIEQLFNRKRQQIEQLIERHEREFMRQLARQHSLLNNLRKRLIPQKEITTRNSTQNDISILTDLKKIENEIDTRLGRGEIFIEITPLNLEDSVMVSLKTYLSTTSSIYSKEISTINQPKKPKHRSPDEASAAFNKWLEVKHKEETSVQKELENTKQKKQKDEEYRLMKKQNNQQAYEQWLHEKKAQAASMKKKLNITDSDIHQKINEA
ncbi:unnamed protein product [Rotaria sordida]|uniref:Uncharacterized protein n=1 Tax=Rotaria sordida TaxID=392033 RepID=A0A813U0H5_9BILA|nr:unnamed protein product [Rotaria sordida]CAF0849185.1 unnamed protein product [Rotaria sordida]CAF1019292.1 unnamed protein product [Rotaria sordida]CAF3498001.1 unnamed protein product [Rotaria sordida]CAF3680211.1 unnamed protein product [Rotaria sordida]